MDSSSPASTGIAANLARIRDRISAAAIEAGRRPTDITLVAVSKTYPADDIRIALCEGQRVFGENRVQEAAAKFPELRASHEDLRLHIIGPLQSNKVRDAVRLADMIETVDRRKLLDALDAASAHEGRLPDLLVQVNVGDEPQKAGVSRADADQFVDECRSRFPSALKGLMCIPPAEENPSSHFDWLAECAARHGLPVVSMGMSADFETAIVHGATHVRVGSAIFGHRA